MARVAHVALDEAWVWWATEHLRAAAAASRGKAGTEVKKEVVHRSLTVKLIAAPVTELVMCGQDESPEQALRHIGTYAQQRASLFDYCSSGSSLPARPLQRSQERGMKPTTRGCTVLFCTR